MFPIRDSIPYHGPALVVKALIAINVVVFFWQSALGPQGFQRVVVEYGLVPALFFQDPVGEGYRLVTSMFLHGSWAHILGNMWFLWVFGPALEGRMGPGRFLGFYLLSGLAAALAQAFVDPTSPIPMVGASGAISGVLGGYFVLFPTAWVLTAVWVILPWFFWLPAATYLGYWALLQFVYGLLGLPGVAWWAHLGGFVAGALLVKAFVRRRRYRAEPYWWSWSAQTGHAHSYVPR